MVMIVFTMLSCTAKDSPVPPKQADVSAVAGQSAESVSVSVSRDSLSSSPELEKSIRVDVTPAALKRFDVMQIKVSGTPDGSQLGFEWAKNGARLDQTGDTLRIGDDFKRGDRIDCAVKVEAGNRSNLWFVSGVVGNAPPVFEGSASVMREQERVYRITVKASDPDGDSLTFSLKPAVDGASINATTGEVNYTAPAGKKDSAVITIGAADGNGGETYYTVNFELQ